MHHAVSRPFRKPPGQLSLRRAGMSYVDLTLTTMILGLIAAIASPKFSDAMAYNHADSAIRRIEADLNYVRGQACYANTPCSITFVASPPSFTTTGVPHTNNSGVPYAVNFSQLGYSISLAANMNSTSSVTYSVTGVPSAGLPLSVLTLNTITVTSGKWTRTVSVDPVTGRARRS